MYGFQEKHLCLAVVFSSLILRRCVWAAITDHGFLGCAFYDGALDALSYIKISKKHLIPNTRKHFKSSAEWTFQQDNAGFHAADEVTMMLEAQEVDILYWPPFSPDLSLIENVWPVMERNIATRPHATKTDLKKAIQDVISEMNQEEPITHLFEKLYLSLSKRFVLVMPGGGVALKY